MNFGKAAISKLDTSDFPGLYSLGANFEGVFSYNFFYFLRKTYEELLISHIHYWFERDFFFCQYWKSSTVFQFFLHHIEKLNNLDAHYGPIICRVEYYTGKMKKSRVVYRLIFLSVRGKIVIVAIWRIPMKWTYRCAFVCEVVRQRSRGTYLYLIWVDEILRHGRWNWIRPVDYLSEPQTSDGSVICRSWMIDLRNFLFLIRMKNRKEQWM